MKRFEFNHEDRENLIAYGLDCPMCAGNVVEDEMFVEHVTNLLFRCKECDQISVLRVDALDGYLKIHFYALPEGVALGWWDQSKSETQ
jgi:hypothetical protein